MSNKEFIRSGDGSGLGISRGDGWSFRSSKGASQGGILGFSSGRSEAM